MTELYSVPLCVQKVIKNILTKNKKKLLELPAVMNGGQGPPRNPGTAETTEIGPEG